MNKRKVLIITYYWPPAGGPGVQRWLKFVKYLRDFDIEPVVYIPENPSYPFKDEELLKEVIDDLEVIRKPIFEPYRIARILGGNKVSKISKGIIPDKKQSAIEKLLLWIRGNFFIPDARKYWVKPSVLHLKNVIKESDINTVITTGPPHSLHLIGCKLKQLCPELKWISDFRDPWTTIGYHSKLKLTDYSARRHKKLERMVLTKADIITVTSLTTKTLFETITDRPIHVITNGYDMELAETSLNPKKFSLAHIGSLLTGRNPEILWAVLKELLNEQQDFAKDFELVLAGVLSEEVLRKIYAYDLKKYTKLLGYISHQEVLELQKNSAVLLLLEINSEYNKCIIPGKLFEYMVSQRPIIAIGPESWDVVPIIAKTNTGIGFNYTQKKELKEKIVSYYLDFKRGELKTQPIKLKDYHRKSLTKQLAKLIKSM
ncbi:glycosyltransferase family 4 protein [Ascidiimonas sp. W6]|uniref:glycosyltransferase family 4 protein n=1 Tax=Ascidiimonas meishanensis TaxID=3128903 RepID=UPI0030EBDA82